MNDNFSVYNPFYTLETSFELRQPRDILKELQKTIKELELKEVPIAIACTPKFAETIKPIFSKELTKNPLKVYIWKKLPIPWLPFYKKNG